MLPFRKFSFDKIDSPDSKIDNYRLLTTKSFIDFYRISKKLIDFYRLLSNAIDYRYYRLTTPGDIRVEINFRTFCFVVVFFSFVQHGSHVVVNTHKFRSSEIMLPNTKDCFPVFSIC